MKDLADNKTPELPVISATVTKKRGRPATGTAKSAAQRKASQRLRDRETVLSKDLVRDWTKKDCLIVLNDPSMHLEMQVMAARQLAHLLSDSHKNTSITLCAQAGGRHGYVDRSAT
jgi:hypothetical protein